VIIRPIVVLPFAIAAAVAALTVLLVLRIITSQNFAFGCVALMGISTAVWSLLLKRSHAQSESLSTTSASSSQNRTDKNKLVRAAILFLLLITSLWITRGAPWAPRLIGAFVLVLFSIATLARKSA
jgi:hypothetical protein